MTEPFALKGEFTIKRYYLIVLALLLYALFASGPALASGEATPLAPSQLVVRITSGRNIATFQLYDTPAARELYDQLPLELETTNFRDAQWMFYSPERLGVTAGETYHQWRKCAGRKASAQEAYLYALAN